MKDNIDFFEYSLRVPEPLVDDFYVKDRDLIISDSPSNPNRLMKTNKDLLENISAYRIALMQGNKKMQNETLKTIQFLMRTKGLNFSEFASFWAVVDVSYSLYASLPEDVQLEFLDSVIRKYLEMRHDVYFNHGYSATTLQVSKDAKSHKSSGSLGNKKTAHLLEERKYSQLKKLDIETFRKQDKIFLFSDKTGKKLFKEILKTFKIKFAWSSHKQNKMPDLLFKKGNEIFIVEHKHMKEGGGGQNKQVAEVVDFVGYSEKKLSVVVHYVTLMDGLYFNLFTKSTNSNVKLGAQIANIRKNLKANRGNYFVNTAGFCALLKDVG